jgi:AraC-like DNA-binding protein
VELAMHLVGRHSVGEVAAHLGITAATLYRWKQDSHTRKPFCSRNSDAAYETIVLELVRECEECGFKIRVPLNDEQDKSRFEYNRREDNNLMEDAYANSSSMPALHNGHATELRHALPLEPRANGRSTDAAKTNKKHYFFDVDKARNSRRVLERLSQARQMIESRYNSRLTCAQLARIAGMSRDHFVRVYKDAFGESAQRHLTRVRVSHARTLLQQTLQPAGLIAVAVGFDSYATLSKAFKSVIGISVSEFCRASQRSQTHEQSRIFA